VIFFGADVPADFNVLPAVAVALAEVPPSAFLPTRVKAASMPSNSRLAGWKEDYLLKVLASGI
jgi:hypothetical protein